MWYLFRWLQIPCLCKTHSIIDCSQHPATDSLLLQTNPVHTLKLQLRWLRTWKGDRGSTVVKVLRYKSEGRWFDPSWSWCPSDRLGSTQPLTEMSTRSISWG